MRTGKAINWRGLVQPKRGRCPKCGKKGLGPLKSHASVPRPYRECRYCRALIQE